MTHFRQYETEQDRENENKVAKWIEQNNPVDVDKLHKKHKIDFIAFHRDTKQPAFLMEIKFRNSTKAKHKFFIISVFKIEAGLRYAELLQVPLFIFVRWTDEAGIIEISRQMLDGVSCIQFNYSNRNDEMDFEPVFKIPVKWFRKVTKHMQIMFLG